MLQKLHHFHWVLRKSRYGHESLWKLQPNPLITHNLDRLITCVGPTKNGNFLFFTDFSKYFDPFWTCNSFFVNFAIMGRFFFSSFQNFKSENKNCKLEKKNTNRRIKNLKWQNRKRLMKSGKWQKIKENGSLEGYMCENSSSSFLSLVKIIACMVAIIEDWAFVFSQGFSHTKAMAIHKATTKITAFSPLTLIHSFKINSSFPNPHIFLVLC